VTSVPDSRDPALTDDIIEAGVQAWKAAARGDYWRRIGTREVVKIVVAAVVPLLRAHIADREILAQAEQQHDLDLWAPRSAVLWAARVARGGDHA
jgi:hypothetical protein